MRALRLSIALAAILWAVSLPLAALAAASSGAQPLAHPFAFLVYGLGSLICHQKADRSFHLGVVALPVCARCTGIYVGAAAASAAALLTPARRCLGALRDVIGARRAVIIAGLPALVSLAYEWGGNGTPGNWIRAATGVPLGMMILYLG